MHWFSALSSVLSSSHIKTQCFSIGFHSDSGACRSSGTALKYLSDHPPLFVQFLVPTLPPLGKQHQEEAAAVIDTFPACLSFTTTAFPIALVSFPKSLLFPLSIHFLLPRLSSPPPFQPCSPRHRRTPISSAALRATDGRTEGHRLTFSFRSLRASDKSDKLACPRD